MWCFHDIYHTPNNCRLSATHCELNETFYVGPLPDIFFNQYIDNIINGTSFICSKLNEVDMRETLEKDTHPHHNHHNNLPPYLGRIYRCTQACRLLEIHPIGNSIICRVTFSFMHAYGVKMDAYHNIHRTPIELAKVTEGGRRNEYIKFMYLLLQWVKGKLIWCTKLFQIFDGWANIFFIYTSSCIRDATAALFAILFTSLLSSVW